MKRIAFAALALLASLAGAQAQLSMMIGGLVGPVGPAAPAQASAAGFTNLAFNSDFSTGTHVSSTGPWYNPGVWFQSAATGSLTPTSAGGVINLSWSPGDSVAGVTVGTMAPSGQATTSYVPTAGAHSYSELDIFEWQSQIPTTFNGHLHTWVAAAGAQVADTQNNDSNSAASLPSGANLANFNTYGVLWTPTTISWYFNNKLLLTANSTTYPAAFSVLNAGPMYLMLSNQVGANWSLGTDPPTSASDMKVQWAHVWH